MGRVLSFCSMLNRCEPRTISAIVPTLDEAAEIEETVRCLRAVPEICEILVADGGSADQTRAIAARCGCKIIDAPRGRGRQLRVGARHATGEVVMFVHADTWLPDHAGRAALDVLRDPKIVGGGFQKVFRDPPLLVRGCRLKNRLRLFFSGRILGDQAMFVRREVLEKIGGVPDVPLMEDFELCRALWKIGRLALANATVTTSARRFRERGVLRTYALMWSVMLQYHFGASPEDLARRYR